MTTPTIIHVVGAAIFDGPRCLVTQRSASMSNPLLWEFPGGKIEAGESPQEALRREIVEELGLEIEVGAFIARGEAPAGAARTVRLDVYQARVVGGSLQLREHAAHRWMHPQRLDTIPFAEADHPAVAALMSASPPHPKEESP